MNGNNRSDVRVGARVKVVQKQDQRTGELTCGIVRNILTKSGIMLGLGESKEEVISSMNDLKKAGCDILTIGQYLVPSVNHHEVVKYISPREFAEYADLGRQLGFAEVFSGPLVRSSLNASEIYEQSTEFCRA